MEMQTTETNVAAADFDAEISGAEAQLAKLCGAAEDAEAEAARWRTAFEREPTSESLANKEIFGQRAKIAKAAAETFERDQLNPLKSAKRQAQLNTIDRELSREIRAAEAQFTKAGNTLFDLAQSLDAAVEQWSALHEKLQTARAAGVAVNAVSLERVIAALNEKLSPLRGNAHELATKHAHIAFVEGAGNDVRIHLEINRPAAVPTTVR